MHTPSHRNVCYSFFILVYSEVFEFSAAILEKGLFHVCLASWCAVDFDLLFVFRVLSCRILDSATMFILYVHEHDRLGFGMLTVETAVFDCIC